MVDFDEEIIGILENELSNEEDEYTDKLVKKLELRENGTLTKEQVLSICYWKSPRLSNKRRAYFKGDPKGIVSSNLEELCELMKKNNKGDKEAERKILEKLTKIKGIGIPMASAILTFIDPDNYGVIDKNVWLYLKRLGKHYGKFQKNESGINFTIAQWLYYLGKLRYWRDELNKLKHKNVSARAVERTLFILALVEKTMEAGRLGERCSPKSS